jgi:hypothetical protein
MLSLGWRGFSALRGACCKHAERAKKKKFQNRKITRREMMHGDGATYSDRRATSERRNAPRRAFVVRIGPIARAAIAACSITNDPIRCVPR